MPCKNDWFYKLFGASVCGIRERHWLSEQAITRRGAESSAKQLQDDGISRVAVNSGAAKKPSAWHWHS
jgi:hypothetical protein